MTEGPLGVGVGSFKHDPLRSSLKEHANPVASTAGASMARSSSGNPFSQVLQLGGGLGWAGLAAHVLQQLLLQCCCLTYMLLLPAVHAVAAHRSCGCCLLCMLLLPPACKHGGVTCTTSCWRPSCTQTCLPLPCPGVVVQRDEERGLQPEQLAGGDACAYGRHRWVWCSGRVVGMHARPIRWQAHMGSCCAGCLLYGMLLGRSLLQPVL